MATTYFYPKSFYDEMVSFQEHPEALKKIEFFDLGLEENVVYDRIDVVVKGSHQIARSRTSADNLEFFLAVKFQKDEHSRTTGIFRDYSSLPEDNYLTELVEIALYEGDLFLTKTSYYTYCISNGDKYYGVTHTREQILNYGMEFSKVFRYHDNMFKMDSLAYNIPKVIMNSLL